MKTTNERYVEVPLSLLHYMADEACLVLAFLPDGRMWVGDEWDIDDLAELVDGDEDEGDAVVPLKVNDQPENIIEALAKVEAMEKLVNTELARSKAVRERLVKGYAGKDDR